MDLTRIATVAAGEAIRQQTDIVGLSRLIAAYAAAHDLNSWGNAPTQRTTFELGQIVEPTVNRRGYRLGPVTFRNGGSSASATEIMRLLDHLFKHIPVPGNPQHVRIWTKEFLWIHPFGDGNGRVAWILYNWLNNRLDYPDPLPDFGW